jgi:predicted lipoprotein with Yx(FWY)xxD motif
VRTKIVTCMLAGALVVAGAACGDDDSDQTTADQSDQSGQSEGTTATSEGTNAEAVVKTSDSDLGEILTTADGMTVYGFTTDTNGESSCVEGCAAAWPPVTVQSEELPAGMDADVFSVTERPDGTYQLKAGDWPLYTFMGDTAAGQTNGQGTGGTWFVVKPDGQLNQGDAAAASGDYGY